jgi:hypothetical protein
MTFSGIFKALVTDFPACHKEARTTPPALVAGAAACAGSFPYGSMGTDSALKEVADTVGELALGTGNPAIGEPGAGEFHRFGLAQPVTTAVVVTAAPNQRCHVRRIPHLRMIRRRELAG